jgi:uncharacterized protein (TIGR03083 family)
MTATESLPYAPRKSGLDRRVAMRLAADEYQRFIEVLASLSPDDWSKPTECPAWDVRAMAAHALGMAEMAASIREQLRQMKTATKRGGAFIDALTSLQVDERRDMSPAHIVARFHHVAPKASRGRRLTPGLIRRRTMPQPQVVGDHEEKWTLGYLIDVILTRDPWMHRIDITRATGAAHVLTPEHDGVLVADVVREWSQRHGKPFVLTLTGPAGGTWTAGTGAETINLDAVQFCRTISGRATGGGLLTVQVPF